MAAEEVVSARQQDVEAAGLGADNTIVLVFMHKPLPAAH